MTQRTWTIDLDDRSWAILERLAKASEYREQRTLDGLVTELLDHVQQGVYRSGSWERDWLMRVIPHEQILRAYLAYEDPINGRFADFLQTHLEAARVGINDAVEIFSSLGTNIEELSQLTHVDAFHVVADAIARIDDTGQRTAIWLKVFGRRAIHLVPPRLES